MTRQLELPRALLEGLDVFDDPAVRDWVDRLPAAVADVAARWRLDLDAPYQPGGTTAWVAPVRTADGADVVLKVGWRHDEAEHEVEGLARWAGRGTVLVHRSEKQADTLALLLERCAAGRTLAGRPEPEQDEVVAGLLRRLWLADPGPPFRPLATMCEQWASGYERRPHPDLDPGLVRVGLDLFRSLPATAAEQRLLVTDLHAGNVLAAEREPWLVIDPKPYVGDPAYDVLQHMLNCRGRLVTDPFALATRLAGLTGVDPERLRHWLFARLVVESAWWPDAADLAVRLAPQ